MFVIKGNTAIFKCIVPSFVADYVSVVSWEDTSGNEYSVSPNDNFGTHSMISDVQSKIFELPLPIFSVLYS